MLGGVFPGRMLSFALHPAWPYFVRMIVLRLDRNVGGEDAVHAGLRATSSRWHHEICRALHLCHRIHHLTYA